jgi:hypothetical protein
MTPAARRLATMLRAKAEMERDPEIRAEWKYIARGYPDRSRNRESVQ